MVAIAAQPFFVTASVNGKERNHVPDFLLIDGDGAVSIVNVKPAERLTDPKVAEALGWAGAAFADRGWQHEIWSGVSAVRLSNVRFLAAYRDPARLDPVLISAVHDALAGPVRLREVEQAWPQRSDEARAAALHLLWRGAVHADLSVPLSAETALERAE